jgi:hypothetical protein
MIIDGILKDKYSDRQGHIDPGSVHSKSPAQAIRFAAQTRYQKKQPMYHGSQHSRTRAQPSSSSPITEASGEPPKRSNSQQATAGGSAGNHAHALCHTVVRG